MDVSAERLTFLFRRYYNGHATLAETDELLKYISEAKDNTLLSALLKEAWDGLQESSPVLSQEVSNRMLHSILAGHPEEINWEEEDIPVVPFEKTQVFRKWLSVAAAVTLLCLAGAYWILDAGVMNNHEMTEVVESDILPGTNKAMLTLGDGSVINLDDTKDGILTFEGEVEIAKANDGRLIYGKATVENGKIPDNIISTPRGGQYQVKLPDGSDIWLNASSTIKFPVAFAGNERRVEITGEVFFEVRKDETRPFIVVFGSNEVEVLGTSFNISHYGDELSSMATLVEGSIALNAGNKKNKLTPGQGATITDDGNIKVGMVNIEEITAWKNGMFYFRDAGIDLVMRQVSRWYNIEVKYEGIIPQKKLAGKVSREVSLDEIMSMLQYAGVNYRLSGRTLTITK